MRKPEAIIISLAKTYSVMSRSSFSDSTLQIELTKLRFYMIKKTLILISLLAWSIGSIAQTATQQLVVWQKSGEKVYFDISELPETTFEDGQLVITTSKATVYYQLENVLRYTYEGIKSGIDLMAGERSVSISRKADAVTFHNLPQGTVVSLYSANGVLIKQQTADGRSDGASASRRHRCRFGEGYGNGA